MLKWSLPAPEMQPSRGSGAAALAEPVMKQGGFYNKNSELQKALIERCLGLVEQAAVSAPLPTALGSAFRVADLGCSQGANSVSPVSAVLRVLQDRAAAVVKAPAGEAAGEASPAPASSCPPRRVLRPLPVEVFHEDLPGNDWGSLFGVVEGEQSYLPGPGECPDLEVYPAAMGRSFHKRLFPRSSVHLVMAFSCLHWLPVGDMPARRPTDTLVPHDTKDPEVYGEFRSAANSHLRRFLALRAEEVVPGGSLVCHIPTHTPGVDSIGPLLEAPKEAVRQMVSEGLLTPDDVPELTMPAFFYRPDDIKALVQDASDAWTVRTMEEERMDHPAVARYEVGQMSKEELVRTLGDCMKAAGEPYMVAALSKRHGPEAAEALVRGLFERVEGLLMEEPLTSTERKRLRLWLQRK